MDNKEFNSFWKTRYPETYPINHELKWIYPDRWFRIHSLPESKRYANSDKEYEMIFDRQNKLIDDLIGQGSKIVISFGLYTDDVGNENYKELTDFGDFTKVDSIDLQMVRSKEYEDEMYFDIYIKNDVWGKRNEKSDFKSDC